MISFKKGTLLEKLVNTFMWDVVDGSYKTEEGTINLSLLASPKTHEVSLHD